ncbi:hypothetical protein [Nannocystis punicea]|uniref:Uncharacterized protein n=1 Tax=Nannocystis punicea TaxID=2995304 RepID=A0ABY7H958_9BACT|nr:hypothetical protein [Nannocystis poenicansa]WAS95802.1 hypothetical protein O0S08_06530 [Nannocystis poenicansa]
MVDTSFLRETLGLRSLADERLGDDGEALRVIYGPTFHANVAITVRRVGDLAELEVLVEGAAPERVMLTSVESAPPLGLLRQPIDAWDVFSRDGIAAHGERWDGRERVLAHIGNPIPAAEPAAYQLLVEMLDFAAARPWSLRIQEALACVRRYLEDADELPPRQARRRRQLASQRGWE